MVEQAGVYVRVLRTRRPGYIVYDDEYQVVAEPFADLRLGRHLQLRQLKNRYAGKKAVGIHLSREVQDYFKGLGEETGWRIRS